MSTSCNKKKKIENNKINKNYETCNVIAMYLLTMYIYINNIVCYLYVTLIILRNNNNTTTPFFLQANLIYKLMKRLLLLVYTVSFLFIHSFTYFVVYCLERLLVLLRTFLAP